VPVNGRHSGLGWQSPVRSTGIAVFLVGGVLDVVFHLAHGSMDPAPGSPAAHFEFTAHLVTLVGMVLTLVGVLVNRGIRSKSSKGAV